MPSTFNCIIRLLTDNQHQPLRLAPSIAPSLHGTWRTLQHDPDSEIESLLFPLGTSHLDVSNHWHCLGRKKVHHDSYEQSQPWDDRCCLFVSSQKKRRPNLVRSRGRKSRSNGINWQAANLSSWSSRGHYQHPIKPYLRSKPLAFVVWSSSEVAAFSSFHIVQHGFVVCLGHSNK